MLGCRELAAAEMTVKMYVGRLLTKLRLRDRAHAVILAYETAPIRPGSYRAAHVCPAPSDTRASRPHELHP